MKQETLNKKNPYLYIIITIIIIILLISKVSAYKKVNETSIK